MSEYRYPDKDDKLFAEMNASESRGFRNASNKTRSARKTSSRADSPDAPETTQPVRSSRLRSKLHRFGISIPKAAPRFSTYWEASEALAFKRCLPSVFPSRKGKVKSADIGCGEGRLLSFLSEHSSAVVGVEPSRERFGKAAQVAESLPNAIVVNGTAEDLPSESFDVVLCSHVIQHISFDEQDKLAANILRILKPDGIALVTTTFLEGEQSRYVIEYWRDGKRTSDIVDASTFDDAYSKDGVNPVRLFSAKDLLSYFDGCELVDSGCYHFSGVKDARLDAVLSRLGGLSRALDAYYVLKKVQRD